MIVEYTYSTRHSIFGYYAVVLLTLIRVHCKDVFSHIKTLFVILFIEVEFTFFIACIDQPLRYPCKLFYVEIHQTSYVATNYFKALIFYVMSDFNIDCFEFPLELFTTLTICNNHWFAHSTVCSLTIPIFV